MREQNTNNQDPKNNDILYNLNIYNIKLDTGFVYYLLGFLIAHKDKAVIEDLYYEILEQVTKQNRNEKPTNAKL